MALCIWCAADNDSASIEHIIPEAMGCPDGFVLKSGEVCTPCNNNLAQFDQAIVDDFDFVLLLADVPRKKGRPPEIRSRGNALTTSDPRTISFNMDRHSTVAHGGSVLGGFGKTDRNVKAEFASDGKLAKINFQTTFGRNPKFLRGILKVALSSIAFFDGADVALRSEFDPVRRFVRAGEGRRCVLLRMCDDVTFRNQVWSPCRHEDGFAVVIRLAQVEFLVDMTLEQSLYRRFVEKALQLYGNTEWSYLPIDA